MRGHHRQRPNLRSAAGLSACATLALALGCSLNANRHTSLPCTIANRISRKPRSATACTRPWPATAPFLEESPVSSLTPEAMRRLADLKLEKEFGLRGGEAASLPSPASSTRGPSNRPRDPGGSDRETSHAAERDEAFEARATATSADAIESSDAEGREALAALPGGEPTSTDGPLEAIALYDRILATYPDYAFTDQVLYQKARAFDELGRVDEAVAVAKVLIERFPNSRHIDEIQFRRGEYFFTRKKFFDAEKAYSAIAVRGSGSEYYELALYKLGWSLYKQMMLDEALDSFVRLLDHKVDTGYDFDQTENDADQQRIADTFRVISLCFSDLGGSDSATEFFAAKGARSYEDRIYRTLGEFYLEKLRYADAAGAYEAFIELHPVHASAPNFSMRVVEIYELGGFPKLVLQSKKDFAQKYGLRSEYWSHFDLAARSEVVDYLKQNLEDLASHYHALFQTTERVEDRPTHFAESASWYRTYLESFPSDPETPAIHYRLADLYLENEGFGAAAEEYERIAYDYAEHDRASDAGYAAIYAHRENEKRAEGPARTVVQEAAVASTLRFVERFASHEHAPTVLSAAVDDLYALDRPDQAISQAHRLIASYPETSQPILRAAWLVIGHASFDTERFENAESAYAKTIELSIADDPSNDSIRDNLAASIYKQGEAARALGSLEAAAAHFLRIAEVAPASAIRPNAEYDAGNVLITLEDWSGAASVFEAFRETFAEHELAREATRQVARVYREDGDLARSAEEYERVAAEADEAQMRREALLVAADLFEEAEIPTRAIAVLEGYTAEFAEPLDDHVIARFKLADLHEELSDRRARDEQLRSIIAIDKRAGQARTALVRLYAARSALRLAEVDFEAFAALELRQPFEKSLKEKKSRMQRALSVVGALVDYEVGEVTAAATYYMAEVYDDFSQSLIASERPSDLTENELTEYEMVLEEEAYPFEEKAIEVHEKNLELMASGVFNRWIEKSIGRLGDLMPGRYAKFESSTGLITSSRSFSYRRPERLVPDETAPEAAPETTVASTAEPPEEAEEHVAPESEGPQTEAQTDPPPASPAPTEVPTDGES